MLQLMLNAYFQSAQVDASGTTNLVSGITNLFVMDFFSFSNGNRSLQIWWKGPGQDTEVPFDAHTYFFSQNSMIVFVNVSNR